MLANVNLAKDRTVLAKNGRVVVIGKEISLKDASLSHQAVMDKGAYGKIVLIS
jgi:hypothetical protein